MWSPARWSRSLPTLVALNAALTLAVICLGADLAGLQPAPPADRLTLVQRGGPCAPGSVIAHVLTGNLLVAGGLLAGACTLGAFTLALLLANGLMLGVGAVHLARDLPDMAPLLWRHVPLEFSALVTLAGVAEYIASGVFWSLAFRCPPRVVPGLVGLGVGCALLVAAAIAEADVACQIRRWPGG